jgi:phage shock protein PspC (stress-responsive transcriptional regulator)
MKKTVTVNLNGRVFTMDEDAYQLLDKYLENIRIYFRREEGSAEIIADFEARIEELFSERVRLGYEVVTIEQVEEVISRVGKPADFGDGEPESRGREEENRKDEKQTFQQGYQQAYQQVKKTFFRDNDNKMLGGVCSGLAAYFGWDVLAVRIIAIVLMFASSFAIVPIYLLAWIIFPAAKTVSEKLQMQGMPITVENIGKTVAAEAEPARKPENRGCMEGFLDVAVALMKICLIGIGCLIGLPLIFALMIAIIVLFAVLFGVGGGLLTAIPFGFIHDTSFLTFDHPLLASTSFIFVIGIPLVVLIYSIVAGIAKFTPVSKGVKWTILAVWILALLLLLGSGFRVNKNHGFWGWQFNVADNIRYSDIYTEQEYVIDQPFAYIDLDDDLICNTQIEQTAEGPATIKISGDERLVKYVQYEVEKGHLRLFAPEWKKWHIGKKFSTKFEKIGIRINTLGVKEIESNSVGNVWIANAFKADSLKLELDGVGKFRADSLDIQFLEATFDGAGEIVLGGQARKAWFEMDGAGSINALDLLADSVYAKVEGVGSVKCNPVAYLKGTVNGIGSLTYKEEPREKNTEISGIGRIGKE